MRHAHPIFDEDYQSKIKNRQSKIAYVPTHHSQGESVQPRRRLEGWCQGRRIPG